MLNQSTLVFSCVLLPFFCLGMIISGILREIEFDLWTIIGENCKMV